MKNFQLFGIAEKVTFGQGGFIIHNNGSAFLFRNSADTDYVEILAKYPSGDDSVATKKYVDDNIGGGGYTSPITTKGQIFIGSDTGTDSTLNVGSNNFVLVPDSTITGGLKWINLSIHPEIVTINSTVSTNSGNITTNSGNISANAGNISGNSGDITTIETDILGINLVLSDHETRITTLEGSSLPTLAKGGLISNNSTSNVAVAVGADGQVLSSDSSEPSGLKWIAQSSGGGGGGAKTWLSPIISVVTHNQTYYLPIVSFSFTSDGTPLEIYLAPRGYAGGNSRLSMQRTSSAGFSDVTIGMRRAGGVSSNTTIGRMVVGGYSTPNSGENHAFPMSGVRFIDYAPPVGTYTYIFEWACSTTAMVAQIRDAYVFVKELNLQP